MDSVAEGSVSVGSVSVGSVSVVSLAGALVGVGLTLALALTLGLDGPAIGDLSGALGRNLKDTQ